MSARFNGEPANDNIRLRWYHDFSPAALGILILVAAIRVALFAIF